MKVDIKEILEEKGIKPTVQRIKVMEFLFYNRIHPTADEIYENLKNEIPTLSRVTIYSTLKLFEEKDLVREIYTQSAVRYDINYQNEYHYHFYCKVCKRVFDVGIEEVNFLKDKGKINIGNHKVEKMEIIFIGICEDCLKKIQKGGV